MDKKYDKRTKRTRRRPKSRNTHRKRWKISNCKTPGHDGILVQEIHFHSRQTSTINEQMPTKSTQAEWMTKGRTTLIQKDPSKRTAPNNNRPITCLPMMWKILTAQIGEEIYNSLTSHGLFPEEQKGCYKVSRGKAKLFYITSTAS